MFGIIDVNVKCQPQYQHYDFTIKMVEGKLVATDQARADKETDGLNRYLWSYVYSTLHTALSTLALIGNLA